MATMTEKIWTGATINDHPLVKPALAAENEAIAAHRIAYDVVNTAQADVDRLWTETQSGSANPAAAVAGLVARATLTSAEQRLDLAKADELRLREAMNDAQEATRHAIFAVLQPQLARQAKARAAALEAAYDTHDPLVAATEVLIHERAGRPIEGWVGMHGDYAARVRERFGD